MSAQTHNPLMHSDDACETPLGVTGNSSQANASSFPSGGLIEPGKHRLAVFVPSLAGGGVAHMMTRLAAGLAERGHPVDLVVARADDSYLDRVPASVNVVTLKAGPSWRARLAVLGGDPRGFPGLLRPVLMPRKGAWELRYLPDLVAYLKRVRPAAMISGKIYPNLVAVWAKHLAGVNTGIILSERVDASQAGPGPKAHMWRQRFREPLVRRYYPWAEGIVAVSDGVADDLARRIGARRERITTIYNPVMSLNLLAASREALDHPWYAPGEPPVILSAGRLHVQKDFPTLLKAFARLRAQRPARLIILGEGDLRPELEALVDGLGIASDVSMPGWAPNPLAHMTRASMFVLSSAWEGFGNVVVEALACGCPVVSTDCRSGPAEILDGGRYGRLVPVGDDQALAAAMAATLDAPPDPDQLRERAGVFSVEAAVDKYLALIPS